MAGKTMTLAVIITCPKDPLIATYCNETFGQAFQDRLDADGPTDLVRHDFARILEDEARKQKWFDWHMAPSNHLVPSERVITTDAQGSPKLLIPEAVIQELIQT